MDERRRRLKGKLSIGAIRKSTQLKCNENVDKSEGCGQNNIKVEDLKQLQDGQKDRSSLIPNSKENFGTEVNDVEVKASKRRVNRESTEVQIIQAHEDSSNLEQANKPLECKTSVLSQFCPICQAPLECINIPAELHISHCLIEVELLPDCPDGINCWNTSIFHFRDYNHIALAAWRCSSDYVPPQISPSKPISKKRSSVSPLTPSNKRKTVKIPKQPIEEDVDGQLLAIPAVKKALFSPDKASTSAPLRPSIKVEPEEVREHNATSESDMVCDMDEALISELCDKYLGEEESSFEKPCQTSSTKAAPPEKAQSLRCDLTVEYKPSPVTKSGSANEVLSRQVSCPASCLSTCDAEELQASFSVSIKAPGLKTQAASTQSPVQVNVLLNESGWEAVQVDGTKSASLTGVDISLCKCSRAMTLKCSVADPKLVEQCAESKNAGMEHKYSAVLHELGLKKLKVATGGVEPGTETKVSTHETYNSLKNKNCQLSIKSFFKSDKSPETKPEVPTPDNTKRPTSAVSSLQLKQAASKCVASKKPVILLAGSDSSRPLTPVALLSDSASSTGRAKTRKPWGNSKLPVPHYKRIPDTPFAVDAFKWGRIDGVFAYFLSHFHSDHYIGLTKKFDQPIYCSKISANLVRLKLGVDSQFLHVLEVGVPRILHNVEIEVFDANQCVLHSVVHEFGEISGINCPGSLMFIFRLTDGRVFLHVGDFRASTEMEQIPILCGVDVLYLDTTYCDPAYDFPSQEEIVRQVVLYARRHIQQNPKTLFVCGSYTIGKEKVFLGLAEALDCRIWARKDKVKVLNCLDNRVIAKRVCDDPKQAQVHVMYMNQLNFQHLECALRDVSPAYTALVAFQPTGWTTNKTGSPSNFKKSTQGHITIYAVPYSEHSSFSELRRFVRFVRPKRIQVTVNVTKQREYQRYFQQWLDSKGGEQRTLNSYL